MGEHRSRSESKGADGGEVSAGEDIEMTLMGDKLKERDMDTSGMLLILGEHDKGTGIPFHPKTVSGRRLRGILADIGLVAKIDNIWDEDGETLDLREMERNYTQIVALGKIVENECKRQGVRATYLPHPAARSKKSLDRLREGLADIKRSESV